MYVLLSNKNKTPPFFIILEILIFSKKFFLQVLTHTHSMILEFLLKHFYEIDLHTYCLYFSKNIYSGKSNPFIVFKFINHILPNQ